MNAILLDLLAFGSVLSGILVITSRNPIISVLFLIAVFVNVACYLILLGINFIGLTYLIIYVGAIAILFLFVVMMINIKLVELTEVSPFTPRGLLNPSGSNLPLGAIVGSLFLYEVLGSGLPTEGAPGLRPGGVSRYNLFDSINFWEAGTERNWNPAGGLEAPPVHEFPPYSPDRAEHLTMHAGGWLKGSFNGLWDGVFAAFQQLDSIGQELYTTYSLWFIVGSCVLLLAMVGPIVICLNPTKRRSTLDHHDQTSSAKMVKYRN